MANRGDKEEKGSANIQTGRVVGKKEEGERLVYTCVSINK